MSVNYAKMVQMKRPSEAASQLPSPVSVSPTDSEPDADLTPGTSSVPPTDSRRLRPKRAILAQDGHSHSEQSVYAALWDAGTSQSDGTRVVTIGLGRLSKLARLTENNCRINIRNLTAKLALEEILPERSRDGVGKTYRVFGYAEILRKRKAAGMEWVVRTKGVAFVSVPHTESVSPAVSVAGHETGGAPPTETGGAPPTVSAPPFRKSFRNLSQETSSSELSQFQERAGQLIGLDDDAARDIIRRCREQDPEASMEEIWHFCEQKILERTRNQETVGPGLLIVAIPKYFAPPASELNRFRSRRRGF